jgi:histidinol-phosphate aminotransferase
MTALDLRHHGDAELAPGLVDLAVNVRAGAPPPWLLDRLAGIDLAAYPDPRHAREAVARRHGREPAEVLLTAGAAEAFVLLARAFTPAGATVVHPQFTEPEAALRAAGHRVRRVLLQPPFRLEAADVPDDADLVVVGNPTNPTSVLHRAGELAGLVRPGRLLVVDEAFADCVPAETDSLAATTDLAGLMVIRSLTKTWGIAGLRAGYVLATPDVIARLANAQPLWAVSAPALECCIACSDLPAVAEAASWAVQLGRARDELCRRLAAIPSVEVVPDPAASFVLLHVTGHPGIRNALRDKGFAVRRGETFPGLDSQWIRVAVRDNEVTDAFVTALKEVLR